MWEFCDHDAGHRHEAKARMPTLLSFDQPGVFGSPRKVFNQSVNSNDEASS